MALLKVLNSLALLYLLLEIFKLIKCNYHLCAFVNPLRFLHIFSKLVRFQKCGFYIEVNNNGADSRISLKFIVNIM